MDQNLLDDSIGNVHVLEPLYDENDQQSNEAEFGRPNLVNNQNFQLQRGILGRHVDLVTNSIKLFYEEDWKLQKYSVYFNPNVEQNIKIEMLNKNISLLGEYVLDRNTIYSFVKYEQKKFTIQEHDDSSGLIIMITINHLCEIEGSDNITLISSKWVQTCLRHIRYERLGCNYYDTEAIITNKRLGVKYCPGYFIGIRQCNNELALCIELSDKFTTGETVLDFLNMSCGNNRERFPCLMNNFKAIIIGAIILTLYNNELYKINAVDENLNIYSTFINEDGSKISYKDYYKQKWNITILNDTQPMLKTTDHNDRTLYLVPELCAITEFTDITGKKHRLKELSQYTNYGPNKTIHKYNQFLSKLHCTQKFLQALHSWNLSLSRQLVRIPGRVLPPMNLKCLNHIIPVDDQGSWTDQSELLQMLETPHVKNWIVLAPSKYLIKVKQFVNNLMCMAEDMAFRLPEPEIVQIDYVSQIRSYMFHLDNFVNRNADFILCVIKSFKSDLYNKINRKLCFEASVPFHLLSLKQIINNDTYKHFQTLTKTVVRINCKFGGVPWSVADIHDENIMVVGLDIYQDSINKHKYVCAVMVSMNGRFTRYYSYVDSLCKQNISEFNVSSIANALSKYKDLNKKLPRGILIYRDGLKFDEESLKEVCISEINLMMEKCFKFYNKGTVPFAYILVRKSDEIKFFTQNNPYNYRNPLPGTIVDSDITNPNIFDFFLISHTVKSGSVSPTYYRIMYNSIPQFLIDELHLITYLLTHLYFKRLHTIQVPAPCKMAYDLAYFCANTLKSTENILLHGYPFFF